MTLEALEEVTIYCPYCGEAFDTVLDLSAGAQEYVEDCQVCCQPIRLRYTVDHSGRLERLTAERDDA